jgi:hypothetical protein
MIMPFVVAHDDVQAFSCMRVWGILVSCCMIIGLGTGVNVGGGKLGACICSYMYACTKCPQVRAYLLIGSHCFVHTCVDMDCCRRYGRHTHIVLTAPGEK